MRARLFCCAVVVSAVAGCAAPSRSLVGPPVDPIAGPLDSADAAIDAEPRIEPIRPGGANKPYQVLGRDYVPIVRDLPFREQGLASWYGGKFHGRRTASGEVYDMHAMTAAHPTLPIPSYARIRNPANGREVVVRINDRGPFHAGRIVDLSRAAAARLDLLRAVAPVELERLTDADIRAGGSRREAVRVAAAPAPSADPSLLEFVAAASLETVVEAEVPALSRRAAPGFWVQLGAFRERAGADVFQRRVASEIESLAPSLTTFDEATFFRVQAGPFASRDEAATAARRMRGTIGLMPAVVERR